MKLSDVREFFWPLLEPLNSKEKRHITIDDISVQEEELDTALDMAIKYYDSEEKRVSEIESKSTIFIGSIGFTVIILIGVTREYIFNQNLQYNLFTVISTMMWIVIVTYLAMTVWYSIKALEKKAYHKLSYSDFIASNENYKRQIILKVVSKTRENHANVNLKVDYMTMAQEYFKRAIVTIVVYSIIAGLNILLKEINIGSTIYILNRVTLNTWLIIAILFFMIINFILLSLLYRKNKGGGT